MSDEKMTERDAHSITLGELLSMRDDLNARLEEKIGFKPDAGFSIEVSAFQDRLSFNGGYPSLGPGSRALVYDYEAKETPAQSYKHAIEAIKIYKAPSKQDKIDALKKQIEELENEN